MIEHLLMDEVKNLFFLEARSLIIYPLNEAGFFIWNS